MVSDDMAIIYPSHPDLVRAVVVFFFYQFIIDLICRLLGCDESVLLINHGIVFAFWRQKSQNLPQHLQFD